MLGKIIFILSSLFAITSATPQGNFCGNVWGNPLNISLLNANTADVQAELFGKKCYCKNEHYNYENEHLYFTTNVSDCLNNNLKKWGACPCPPDVVYNKDDKSLVIVGTPLGNVSLLAC